jgi:hypothetical protein
MARAALERMVLTGWLRELGSDQWLSVSSRYILILAGIATIGAFLFAPLMGLICWSRLLATIALSSTIAWSALAFVGIYYGRHALWEHRDMLGPGVFIANGVYWIAIGLCSIGIRLVWVGQFHWHMVCIIAAEALFWIYDKIVIKSIDDWRSKMKTAQKKKRKVDDSWALKRKEQLQAWIHYVDRPAVFAFLVLWVGGGYLKFFYVLTDDSLEVFSSGALFFALMTTNLVFYAANLAEEGSGNCRNREFSQSPTFLPKP